MFKSTIALVALVALFSGADAKGISKGRPTGAAECGQGMVYFPAGGGCVQHLVVTSSAQSADLGGGPDLNTDPNCQPGGKGFQSGRYDVPFTAPDGRKAVAHKVCGTRK